MGHPDNYTPADPLVTPAHIVPEWYFLPFYAILRAVPDIWFIPAKLAGVLAMFGSIFVLFLIPWLDTSRVRSSTFRPVYKWFFWVLVLDVLVLGLAGSKPPEGDWLIYGRIATAYYFVHFIIVMPLIGWFERPRPLPDSIGTPVLAGGGAAAGAAARDKA
jgi:ubiquinol-cytochrome c reductase cytochrome b subunit